MKTRMNEHEALAYRYICNAASEYIGGWENVLEDYCEGDEEHTRAQAVLTRSHDDLVEDIYLMVMAESDKGTNKHLRFAGSEWVRDQISNKLTRWGY